MNFIRDCLAGFIVTACMKVLDIKTLDERPNKTKLPDFLHLTPKPFQMDWMNQLCKQILMLYVYMEQDDITTVTEMATELDNKEQLMKEMFEAASKQYFLYL